MRITSQEVYQERETERKREGGRGRKRGVENGRMNRGREKYMNSCIAGKAFSIAAPALLVPILYIPTTIDGVYILFMDSQNIYNGEIKLSLIFIPS